MALSKLLFFVKKDLFITDYISKSIFHLHEACASWYKIISENISKNSTTAILQFYEEESLAIYHI